MREQREILQLEHLLHCRHNQRGYCEAEENCVLLFSLRSGQDEYYVVGYSDKHEKLVSFRVDRIDRCPEILDEDAEPRPEKEELMRHIRTMTSMYDSRRERVTLLCDNAMMNAVVDAFGEDVETKAFGDDAFTVETETAASPVFYRWVFGYGGKIRITEPENVKREYAEMVKSAFGNTCGRCGA